MAIKISIGSKENEHLDYPYIGELIHVDQDADFLVLFTEPRAGFVLSDTRRDGFRIGLYVTALDEQIFTHFTGKVTLSNI